MVSTHARRKLKPPDRLLSLLGRQTGVWLWTLHPGSRRLDVYTDLTPLLGTNPASLDEILAFLHPDDVSAVARALERGMREGTAGEIGARLRLPSGGWVHFHASYCAEAARGGYRLHGVSRDFTPHVEHRREVEASLRRAYAAAALSGIGLWRFGEGAERFEWSEGMYRIYGIDPSRPGPTVAENLAFIHPDDQSTALRHNQLYARTDESPELAVRIVRADGEVRHVQVRSSVERDEAGRIVGRIGACVDVTELRAAEAKVRQSEQRYRFITENAQDMIVRVSLDARLSYISPGSVRVFGYTPEEMASISPVDMTHPDDMPMVAAAITELVAKRLPHLDKPLRYRARRSDGQWIWIESNPALLFDEHGEPVETIDIIRNVTEAKNFELELEEARRQAEAAAAAKSAFLANMSHELRTPLTSIIGFARLLVEREDLAEDARRYAGRIGEGSEALLAIINDVLDFSKLEAGQVELEAQPFSVEQLVEEATGLVAIQAAGKGLDIRTRLDPATPPLLTGDVARLRQVLLNFLSNAVKFTGEGSVTVRTRWRDGRLRLSVADTGPGIAPESRQRLFERFSQAETSINRTHGGTGLGLAISKAIIELMGGQVGLRSRPGRGSVFWLEVPAAPASEPAASALGAREALECPALRVLMVDDTAVNRELVRLILEPSGVQLDEADGGAAGVKAAMTSAYDLILMDLRMPGVDGLEATRVIRAAGTLNRATPILALTADVQPENAAACLAAGMNDVLAKPIVPRQLIAKIIQWGTGEDAESEGAAA
jgi:PAS domain S-box-containing protein